MILYQYLKNRGFWDIKKRKDGRFNARFGNVQHWFGLYVKDNKVYCF